MALETRRNLFHLVMGVCIVLLLYFDLIDVWIILGVTLAGFLLSSLCRRKRVPVIGWFLQRFEREEYLASFPGRGALFFFVGLLLVVALFPKDIALASIVIVILGDSVSPIVGVKMGRVSHPFSDKRFIEGSIAGFVPAFLGAMLFVSPVEAFLASFFSMIVEAIDSVKGTRIDDNITMPLVAGVTIFILRMLF